MSKTMHAIMADHQHHNQECMGLLPDHRCGSKVAATLNQDEMPCRVQTKEKPVVLMIAPQTILTDPDSEEARRELARLRTN
ncbi:unnamed protein product [Bursaphelenchus okinawaensis]|uniref:Uncharacterized protein n=1 Tax=Bursaphelenchus okinawaensis TaxID=465554 RepID=A0A811KC31_9BILA|nr:unnamed protein product [Bursaphelenchus okinawaensis]CAG9100660.1 unnamed protein product [Bursaphelenchus okinawaensis]